MQEREEEDATASKVMQPLGEDGLRTSKLIAAEAREV